MRTASKKNKGRLLQQYVRDKILEYFPTLSQDDVISTSMGNFGEDIKLSKHARELLPISIECKSYAEFAVYKHYIQAEKNAKEYQPVLIIKQNRADPLVILDLDYFLDLMKLGIDKNAQ